MLGALITVAAVLALAALNGWLGRSGSLTRPREDAAARMRLDLIDFEEQEGEYASEGRARIALGTAPGDLAVAVQRGDGWVTRRLRPSALRAVVRDGARLDVRTHDFTLPRITLEFADEGRAALWETRLHSMPAINTGADTPAAPALLLGRSDGLA
jgi:hypothetical protein